MPVPISITHPQGAGLRAANPSELPTDGPFARLAKQKQEQQQQQQGQACSGEATGPGPQSAAAANGATAPRTAANGCSGPASISVQHLEFSYPGLDGRPVVGQPPLITDMCLALAPGSRCLLIGANGAGKTTLLKILGGKHMVPRESVNVLGRPPFHDTALTSCGDLSYVGGNWTRDIAFAGTSIPLTGDFPASRMIDSAATGVDPARKERLIRVLDIDPNWRMHQVSDGQRRRVQICVGLMRPFKVLLLDEITVDLDVLGRADLMAFLADECKERGATIVYATHIFDGLESWPTHVAYVARGRLQFLKPAEEIPQLKEGRLLEMVASLLREERDALRKAGFSRPVTYDPAREGEVGAFSYVFNNGWVPGTMHTSLANSSNAVMRG